MITSQRNTDISAVLNELLAFTPSIHDVSWMSDKMDVPSFLRYYNTVGLTLPRQCGKTSALVDWANHHNGVYILAFNLSNKQLYLDATTGHIRENQVLTSVDLLNALNDPDYRRPVRAKYILVDEPKIIYQRLKHTKVYQWASLVGDEYTKIIEVGT